MYSSTISELYKRLNLPVYEGVQEVLSKQGCIGRIVCSFCIIVLHQPTTKGQGYGELPTQWRRKGAPGAGTPHIVIVEMTCQAALCHRYPTPLSRSILQACHQVRRVSPISSGKRTGIKLIEYTTPTRRICTHISSATMVTPRRSQGVCNHGSGGWCISSEYRCGISDFYHVTAAL